MQTCLFNENRPYLTRTEDWHKISFISNVPLQTIKHYTPITAALVTPG